VDGRGEDDARNTARGGGLGTSLGVDPTNLFDQVVAGVDGLNGWIVDNDGVDVSIGVAATQVLRHQAVSQPLAVEENGCWMLHRGKAKKKKRKAFTQPLQIAWKSPSNACDEGDEGSSFGNIMYMMMM